MPPMPLMSLLMRRYATPRYLPLLFDFRRRFSGDV